MMNDDDDDDDDDGDDGDDDNDDDDDNDNDDDVDDDDDVEPFRKSSAVQMEGRYHLVWGGEEGGGEGGPFSWSFRDKGSSPPLCFAK